MMIDEITRLMRLLEFSDSAFPVGTFSFSNGLETAAFEGIVYDAQTLEQYTRTALRQTIYSDAIAALIAFRAAAGGNLIRWCCWMRSRKHIPMCSISCCKCSTMVV